SGRAGRGSKPGSVLLQTRLPNHPSIAMTRDKNFDGFARLELTNRKNLSYPPFTRILRIVISAPDKNFGMQYARTMRELIDASVSNRKAPVAVLGPAAAPIERLRALWRWHLLIKGRSASQLN